LVITRKSIKSDVKMTAK